MVSTAASLGHYSSNDRNDRSLASALALAPSSCSAPRTAAAAAMKTKAVLPLPEYDPMDDNPSDEDDMVATPTHPGKGSKGKTVIGSHQLWELAHCPCCRQTLDESEKSKIDQPSLLLPSSLMDRHCFSDEDSEEEEELKGLAHADLDEDESRLAPGTLGAGVKYTPTKVLVEGWLHKKGTGQDWLGSRAWKARWGRLCLARVQGHGVVEVPLLLMYWYPSSKTATTAIVLDSTVVVAVDAPDLAVWNAFRFEIRHAVGTWCTGGPVTRTFCAAQRSERDEWVYAMAQALLNHAKSKQAVKTLTSTVTTVRRELPKEPFLNTVDRAASPPPPTSTYHRSKSPLPEIPKSPRSGRPKSKIVRERQ